MIQNILWGIVIVVLVLWLLGFFFKIASSLSERTKQGSRQMLG